MKANDSKHNIIQHINQNKAAFPEHLIPHHKEADIITCLEEGLLRTLKTPYGIALITTQAGRKYIGKKKHRQSYSHQKILDRLYLARALEQLNKNPRCTVIRTAHPPIVTMDGEHHFVYAIASGYKVRSMRFICKRKHSQLFLGNYHLLFIQPQRHHLKTFMQKQKNSKFGMFVRFYHLPMNATTTQPPAYAHWGELHPYVLPATEKASPR